MPFCRGRLATARALVLVLVVFTSLSVLRRWDTPAAQLKRTPVPPPECTGKGNLCGRCRVAILSTYPPKECGIAQYSHHLVLAMNSSELFRSERCELEVFAFAREGDTHQYNMYSYPVHPFVMHGAVESDEALQIAAAVNAGFSHCILHAEFGLTPVMWQMADMLRYLDPKVVVVTVMHSTTAYSTIEAREFTRQLARSSARMAAMSWHGIHTLTYEYGVPPESIAFVPHGVFVAAQEGPAPEFSHPKIDKDTVLMLSYGLIHEHKGFERLFRILPQLKIFVPKLKVAILGVTHKQSNGAQYMSRVMEFAGDNRDIIIWENRFIPEEELRRWFSRADLYFNLYTEVTPVSGSLLEAMSHGMAIVCTPFRFALEMLAEGRGLIVPYEDDQKTKELLVELLNDPPRRKAMGEAARRAVEGWDWKFVGQNMAELLLRPAVWAPLSGLRVGDGKASLTQFVGVSDKFVHLPPKNRHERETAMPLPTQKGAYVLYVDALHQVNGFFEEAKLTILTVRSSERVSWFKGDGTYEERFFEVANSNNNSKEYGWVADGKFRYTSKNIDFTAKANNGQVEFFFGHINKYAHAHGMIGGRVKCLFGKDCDVPLEGAGPDQEWAEWRAAERNAFGRAQGQIWRFHCFRSDVLAMPQNFLDREKGLIGRLIDSNRLNVTIEGPFFDNSGFAEVNRQMAQVLFASGRFRVGFAATDMPSDPLNRAHLFASLDVHFSHFLSELSTINTLRQPEHCGGGREVLVRNQWPPNPHPPHLDTLLVVQQPWEFGAFPKAWERFLRFTDELWVPSEYCRKKYINEGVPLDRVFTIPHGITRYMASPVPPPLAWNRLRFTYIGSLVPRKGVEGMLEAFLTLFRDSDRAELAIHANSWDDPVKKKVEELANGVSNVHLDFQDKSRPEVLALLQNTDVLMAVYKSEGFGLTIPLAMSLGIVPIVPKYGPAMEYCGKGCLFVEGKEVPCLTPPCGPGTIFGEKATSQPVWFEASPADLQRQMAAIAANPTLFRRMKREARAASAKLTWLAAADLMEKRLRAALVLKFTE